MMVSRLQVNHWQYRRKLPLQDMNIATQIYVDMTINPQVCSAKSKRGPVRLLTPPAGLKL